MRNLLLTALLLLGLGGTASLPTATSDQPRPAPPSSSPPTMPGQRPGPFLVVVGLTDDQTLVAFASTNPTKLTTLGPITGLTGDQRLIGLDCRVSDSTAYGRSHRHPPPGVTVADTALTIPPGHRGHQRGDRVGLQQRR